jgi:hypothetical protein
MFLNGFVLREEPCTDPYARFCGQTGAAAPSDPIQRNAPNDLRPTCGAIRLAPIAPYKLRLIALSQKFRNATNVGYVDQRRGEGRPEREARRGPASAACRPSLSTAGLGQSCMGGIGRKRSKQ